jgi:hypothetical protein
MAMPSVDFSDIRIIVCSQGYHLDYQYIPREIGFYFNGQSGSVPFNVKLNKNHLDVKNLQTVLYAEEEIHGIKLKRNYDNALAVSDLKSVIRTLFHLNSASNAKYIAIARDENLEGLFYKSGLGNYLTYLDNINVLRNTNTVLPSNEAIKQYLKKNPDNYNICGLHEKLRQGDMPLCSKVKAEFLANFCKSVIRNQQIAAENSAKSIQNFITEFDFTNFS